MIITSIHIYVELKELQYRATAMSLKSETLQPNADNHM